MDMSYDELTLISRRDTQQRPPRTHVIRNGMLILLVVAIIGAVGAVIIAPLAFHLLPDQYQNGLARRVPALVGWLPTPTITPTREYSADTLPTTDSTRAAAALALLQATDVAPITLAVNPLPPTPTQMQPPTNTPLAPVTQAAASAQPIAIAALPTNTVLPTNMPPTPTMMSITVAPITATAPPTLIPPTVIPTDIALPTSVHLTGYSIIYQTWNNCGPANLAQVLNAYGLNTSQKETAAWLKPAVLDSNVSPWQLADYVNTHTTLRALQRVNGNLTLLKRLLAAQFRPIIETGFYVPDKPEEGWMGHYLTPVGYDDDQGMILGFDSYLGDGPNHQGRHEAYADLDARWKQFNRQYVVVYPADREAELRALLGTDADPTVNAQGAAAQAKQEAQANAADAYAWFNLGSSYVLLKQFPQAAAAYDQARNAGTGLPWRMLWYQFGPFSAYYHIGDYKTTTQLLTVTLGTTKNDEELYYWRGMVELAQNKAQAATADFNFVLQYNPNYHFAADALANMKTGSAPVPPDVP